jgi:putative membrane protein
LVRVGPVVPILAVALLAGGSTDGTALLIRAGILVVVLILGWIRWLVTKWRVADGAVQIDTGLLRRSSLRFPLTQIQAIDVVSPGLARIFGLSELRIRMASGSRSTGRLAYMPGGQAEQIRLRLLALTSSTATPSNESPRSPASARPVFIVNSSRLVGSVLLSRPALIGVAVLIALIAVAVVSPGAATGIAAGSVGALVALVTGIWRRLNGEFGLNLAVAEDGIHVRTGLVETTAETIPWGRIQALRTVQPLLWRPLGWSRLEVDVAGRGVSGRRNRSAAQAARALVPVGTTAETAQLVELIMPGAPADRLGSPTRARWKAPLRYGRLSFAVNGNYAVTTSGRVRNVTDRVPLAKVQSVRWTEGPLQRRLRLASVHLDTAGRSVFAVARDRDADEARQIVATLPDICRQARTHESERLETLGGH